MWVHIKASISFIIIVLTLHSCEVSLKLLIVVPVLLVFCIFKVSLNYLVLQNKLPVAIPSTIVVCCPLFGL